METTEPIRKAGRPATPITKDRLIAIAAEVFAEHGFHAATLDTIARGADIRRASLLHHFSSKQVLYNAVLDTIVGDMNGFVADARASGGDFITKLDGLGSRMVTYLGKRRGVGRLLMRELVDGGPYFCGCGEKPIMDTLEITAEFLKAGMDAGAFTVQDPRQLALSIVGIHLYAFAAMPSNSRFLGKNGYSDTGIERRRDAVLSQVRLLCLKC
jgi:AcrR family transcriptional regulator